MCLEFEIFKIRLEFLIFIVLVYVFSIDATIDRQIGNIVSLNTRKAQLQEITAKVTINCWPHLILKAKELKPQELQYVNVL